MVLHKTLVLTFPGMTAVCAAEIKELTGKTGKELHEGVLFETTKLEDLFTMCYRSQSASRVLLVLSEGLFEKLAVPDKHCDKTISLTGKSTTQAQALAERLQIKHVYKNAELPLYLHTENHDCWLGIDIGDDLSKRDYRIFLGSETLKGTTAYAALRIAGYEPHHHLLDPFCRAGSIVIEAALHALQMPVRHYSKDKLPFVRIFTDTDAEQFFKAQDKHITHALPGIITAISEQFPSIQATRKNAKIAGVAKAIDFSRTALDWLDIKFQETHIDRIVTQPIELSKNFPVEKFKKLVSLFFERARPILKKDGKICLVLRQGKEEYLSAAKEKGFVLEHQSAIMQGKEEWTVLVFSRT